MPNFNVLDYIKYGLCAGIFGVCCFCSWYVPHSHYVAYKAQIEAAANKQIALNEFKEKQHTLIVQGIKDEYQSKLDLLNRAYPVGVRPTGTSTLLSGQGATINLDAKPSYDVLVNQCSKTTLMLVELQKYENERLGLNDPQ